MLKAAFITPGAFTVPSSMGGSVERVVEKVVPGLQPAVNARIYGRLGKKLPARGQLSGVRIERFPASDKSLYFRRVRERLAKFSPDVIQIENRPLWVPPLKRAFPHSRIWLNLHSTTFISAPYISKAKSRKCLQSADVIQVNSEFLRSQVAGLVPLSASKIKVNHLGVDAASFPGRSTEEGAAMRVELRNKMGWGERPIVLYVGRLIPQKGVHHLLAAIPELVARSPDVLVVIVGSSGYGLHRQTRYVKMLHGLAKKWKSNVHFQSYVPHHRIPQWFVMADISVVPSVGKEAFGLVNLEAMAAELPVVTTTAGGMGEIVVNSLTGYLVTHRRPGIVPQLASRIAHLLGNEAERKEMGRRGRERVLNEFQWRHTSERWLSFQDQ